MKIALTVNPPPLDGELTPTLSAALFLMLI
jgi:hypothetical protein